MKHAILNVDGKHQRHPILACIEWTMACNKELDKDILSQDYVVSFLINFFLLNIQKLELRKKLAKKKKP
jgi:hypothetical protein